MQNFSHELRDFLHVKLSSLRLSFRGANLQGVRRFLQSGSAQVNVATKYSAASGGLRPMNPRFPEILNGIRVVG